MNKSFEAIKTTITGGIIFLVPLVVVTAVMGKALQYMIRRQGGQFSHCSIGGKGVGSRIVASALAQTFRL